MLFFKLKHIITILLLFECSMLQKETTIQSRFISGLTLLIGYPLCRLLF